VTTDQRNRDLTLAWHIDRLWALVWSGKFPSLSEVLLPPSSRKVESGRQTGKQVASALHVLAATYGLTVTKGPKPTHVH
jgi:hypothetical protein